VNEQNSQYVYKINRNLTHEAVYFCKEDSASCIDKINGERYLFNLQKNQIKKIQNAELIGLSKDEEALFRVFTLLFREEYERIESLHDQEIFQRSFRTETSGSCGTPTHWSDPLIPDFHYGQACAIHDQCYGTYTSKSQCDFRFLEKMERANFTLLAEIRTDILIDSPVTVAVYKALLDQLADGYYAAVKNSQSALIAYCQGKPADCINLKGDYSQFINNGIDPSVCDSGQSSCIGGGDGNGPGTFPSCLVQMMVCTGGGCNYYTQPCL
ncbi:hypothetical protein H5201_22450, partial [Pseudoalteromonas sp. SG43-6]